MFSARNQTQHTGRFELGWASEHIQITGDAGFELHGFEMFSNGQVNVDASSMTGEKPNVKFIHNPGIPALQGFENRHPKRGLERFPLPNSHLGKPFTNTNPVEVAIAGLAFYQSWLQKALDKMRRRT